MRIGGAMFFTDYSMSPTELARALERIEAMKEIWTKSKAEYHGEFVNFDPMMTWPKPVQKPYPPIIVGGAFPFGPRRALRYGDGWMPHRTRSQYADVQALLPKFREMAAEAARDPASVPITIWGAKENLDLLKRDRDDGVTRLVVSLDFPLRPIRSCRNSTAGRR